MSDIARLADITSRMHEIASAITTGLVASSHSCHDACRT
jgi:hypothetical protein